MSSTVNTNYAYGSPEEVQEVYNSLPTSAAEAQTILEKVGSDGYVILPDGSKVALPLFFQAAIEKYGMMAFAGKVLAYFAGYPNITLGITLKTFLNTSTMIAVLANEIAKHGVSLSQIDADAYAKKLYSEYTANPMVFKEAAFAQGYHAANDPNHMGLAQQIAMAGIDGMGNTRSPYKNGRGSPINITLLLFLIQTGQIGLVMMILYRHRAQMSSQLNWNLLGVLNMHSRMKREIMKQVATLGKAAPDDPAVYQKMQEIQQRSRQVDSSEELVAGMLSQTRENLRNFFELLQQVLRTENATALAAARG